MTREELIEVMARAICAKNNPDGDENWYKPDATAALAALEAAGVGLVLPSEAEAQLIDGEERMSIRVFYW